MEQAGHAASRRQAMARLAISGLGGLALGGLGLTGFSHALLARSERLGAPEPFDWDSLVARAQDLAARPYVAPAEPTAMADDFDAFGALAYGQAEPLGQRIRLFPVARAIAPHPVGLHLLEGGSARRLIDTMGMFAHGGHSAAAGFRVLHAQEKGDWLAFLGASYFRAAGSQNQYGLSARAVAVDTGLAQAEEFPAFTEFWIEETGRDRVRIFALLDGPSVTGACSFDCGDGPDGVAQDVRLSLFVRRDIARLGVAPLTSMFWYDQRGQQGAGPAEPGRDWRPEIHDSDGLAIHAGNGERIWRPLENAPHARVTSFRADGVKGFGLLQRDRAFSHYQDDGAFYERRPSLWVEPGQDWGAGRVLLYEMPTQSETQDNIVAFWVGDEPARAGQRRDLAYRLRWTSAEPEASDQARCVDRFEGVGGKPGAPVETAARKYVFDFAGPVLAGKTRAAGIEAVTDVPQEAIAALSVYPLARPPGDANGAPQTWRVMIDVHTAAAPRPEMRLFLRQGAAALSETVIAMLRP
ncbi:glucan biosynthesis protein [Novosphingobium sp. 1949]|uniref:Glucan biosynthesis protein n=1 Tax=Novosphingobium organovorum TaxID=2930092 RepID=A0ABT0BHF3_9SPHN|nr:glucan biosynthesis protein [Novosphingobium organovorum]MCJ2184278.1 glucan biosynthesis protein [Novosphingobium organovorum]